jgi:hypothetical protein
VEQLNAQGMVIKRFDAQASAAERERKAAEEEERHKREAISKEEGRRNRALLATYTNEKDIDNARTRALKDNEGAVKDIEKRIGGLQVRLSELKKELDFYSGKNKPPAKLAYRHPQHRVRHQHAGRADGDQEEGSRPDQRALRRRQEALRRTDQGRGRRRGNDEIA